MKPAELHSKRFVIHHVLGRGGMGVVYQALDRNTGALVALKSIGPVEGEALLRFKREFRTLADVRHRNFVRLGELFCEDGQWFFTMELVRGRPLLEYIRGRVTLAADSRTGPTPQPGAADSAYRPAGGEQSEDSLPSLVAGGKQSEDSLPSLVAGGKQSEDSLPSLTMEMPSGGSKPERAAAGSDKRPLPQLPLDETRLRDALGQLAQAIDALHQRGCIHRDIKPSNVLVEDGGRIVLLDFGLIRELDRDAQLSDEREGVVGTPLFMAPEQGMGGKVDASADWYAFGALLYVALTGVPPFQATSSYYVMRAKLLTTPKPPQELVPGLPDDLAALCLELLRVEPSKRPAGQEILARLGVAVPSEKIQRSAHAVFLGRTQELNQLGTALHSALSDAESGRAIFVHGDSGMGKTALVTHFLTTVAREHPRATVVAGRCFEQENMPFRAFDTAIDALATRLYRLPPDELERVLGHGVQYLAAMFPVLRRVPAIAERLLSSSQLRDADRRSQAFEELRALLGALGHNALLVLFIDDLQWADEDSLALLKALLTPPLPGHLLFLATLRTPATASALAWLEQALGQIAQGVYTLGLGALTRSQAQALLEALWKQEGTVAPAGPVEEPAAAHPAGDERAQRAARVLEEAGGHPLFLTELARWSGEADVTALRLDHVLLQRVAQLSPGARRVLEVSALVGVPVRYPVLTAVAGLDEEQGEDVLAELRLCHVVRTSRKNEHRLIEPYHDRLREALVAALDAHDERALATLHHRIGRALLERTHDTELDSEVFTIVSHLNRAIAVIAEDAQRQQLTALNLRAGRLALRATSARSALPYLEQALALLDQAQAAPHDPLVRKVQRELLEAELLGGRLEAGLLRLAWLHETARNDTERAELYEIELRLNTSLSRHTQAISAGRAGLRRLGVSLPRRASQLSLLREYLAVQRRLRGRSLLELDELPALSEDRLRLVVRLLMAISQPAFHADQLLFSVILLRLMRLSLDHGLSDVSGYALASYGFLLCGAFRKVEQAYQVGELADRLGERLGLGTYSGRVDLIRGGALYAWVRPFAEGVPVIQRSIERSRRYGDVQYEAYACGGLALTDLCMGLPLEGSQARVAEALHVVERRQEREMIGTVDCIARLYAALSGQTSAPTSLARPGEDPQALCERHDTEQTPVSAFYYNLMLAELYYFDCDYPTALHHIDRAAKNSQAIFGAAVGGELQWFRGLIAAHAHGCAATWRERWRLRRLVGKTMAMLRHSAEHCPANWGAQYWMVAAEAVRIAGNNEIALRRYGLAIEAARVDGSIKREAMALELAGRLCRQIGDHERASAYERKAIEAYKKWGARWKAAQLAETHLQSGVSRA